MHFELVLGWILVFVVMESQDPYDWQLSFSQLLVDPDQPSTSRRHCQVERSLLWEITGSLAAAGNDLRVGNQLFFSKSKIIIKQTVFNHAHTKDPRPTSSIQR